MNTLATPELTQFAIDVSNGLSALPKYLSSKYFYDDEGSRLFQEIMKLPEYYLTGCELEIFSTQTDLIYKAFTENGPQFDLVELGAGDGTKTAVLVDHFLKQGADLQYSPIDISQEATDALVDTFTDKFPSLNINARTGDYFKILDSLRGSTRPKILMFLGSNIGNFGRQQSIDFFRQLRGVMNDRDLLFVGFDLQKDPHVIAAAYDDAQGVTARFNLNLLKRINNELGGNFDISKFTHYANYRPIEGSARSYLVSLAKQTVRIDAIDREFEFDEWEPVFMEISRKYSPKKIESLAAESGFTIKDTFCDSRKYYCNSLWQPSL